MGGRASFDCSLRSRSGGGFSFDAINTCPHPEEAAKRPSRRTQRPLAASLGGSALSMSADDLVHAPSRNTGEDDDPLRRVRLEKLAALRDMGIEPYPVTFSRTAEAADLDKRHADLAAGAETEERVRVAGRIRAMRNSGMFIDLHDASGKIQIFLHKHHHSTEQLTLLRLLEL